MTARLQCSPAGESAFDDRQSPLCPVYLPVSLICSPISDSRDRIHDAVASEADAAPQYISICHSGSAIGGGKNNQKEPRRNSAAKTKGRRGVISGFPTTRGVKIRFM